MFWGLTAAGTGFLDPIALRVEGVVLPATDWALLAGLDAACVGVDLGAVDAVFVAEELQEEFQWLLLYLGSNATKQGW